MRYRPTLFKLLIFNLIVPLIIFAAITVALGVLNYNRVFRSEQERLGLITEQVVHRIDATLRERSQLLGNLALLDPIAEVTRRLPEIETESDYNSAEWAVQRTIMQNLGSSDGINLLYVGSEADASVFANLWLDLPADFDARTRPWYVETARTGRLLITDPYLTAEGDAAEELVISLAHPITRDGRLLGVAALDTGFAWIERIHEQTRREYGASFSIFSDRGSDLIWSEDRAAWGTPLERVVADFGYDATEAAALRAEISSESSFYFEGDLTDGAGTVMIRTGRVPSVSEWGVLLVADKQIIVQETFSAVVTPLLVTGGIFLIILGAAFLISARTILTPLNFVSRSLGDLAEGDGDLTVHLAVDTKDDIRRLADNFNTFVGKICALVVNIKNASEMEQRASDELTSSIDETNTSMNEIVTNIASIEEQMDRLESAVGTSVTSVEEITHNIRGMIDQMSSQATMVEQTGAAITEIMSSIDNVAAITERKTKSVEQLTDVVMRGKSQFEATNRNFYDGVVARIDQIRDMTKSIENIAAQTNLLSMNAAIEAAHAGDAGRGFAVVAAEIRKLADEAGRSSKQITETLQAIISSVEDTSKNQRQTAKDFDLIVGEVRGALDAFTEINGTTRELSSGGGEITNAVGELNDVTASVKAGSEEIRTGTDLMLKTQTVLRDVSAVVTRGVGEIVSNSEGIRSSMQLLATESRRLRDAAASLNNEVSRFKTV